MLRNTALEALVPTLQVEQTSGLAHHLTLALVLHLGHQGVLCGERCLLVALDALAFKVVEVLGAFGQVASLCVSLGGDEVHLGDAEHLRLDAETGILVALKLGPKSAVVDDLVEAVNLTSGTCVGGQCHLVEPYLLAVVVG